MLLASIHHVRMLPRSLSSVTAVRCFCLVCGVALLTVSSERGSAQVMIDADHLDGKLPDWVDRAYIVIKPPAEIVVRSTCEPPIHEPVSGRIWHPPVVKVCWDRVWIAARYEWHDCGCGGARELICVEDGHYATCRREVVVTPGYWEAIEVIRSFEY